MSCSCSFQNNTFYFALALDPSGPSDEGRREDEQGSLGARDLSRPPAPDNSNAWGSFWAGARRIIDTIIDLGEDGDEDDEDDEEGVEENEEGRRRARYDGVEASQQPGDLICEEELRSAKTTAPQSLFTLSTAHVQPSMRDVSNLMDESQVAGLILHFPLRHRQSTWNLVYSTQRDGISMQTLLRKARGRSPTVLVVRDMGKAVFGAYCSEPWHLAPRYYGTGETFVFQLSPKQVVWHWWSKKMDVQQNDYFMWGSSEALAVGGAGGYALWLDAELSHGISRSSLTFGNDSLSSTEEFRIGAVELWWLK